MNILLTSAGRRSYIVDYFKACQGIDKVYACNSSYTIACQRADGYFISPLIYDSNYIPALIDFCKANKITALLSLFDIDLLVLAKNKKAFEDKGITLVLAPESFIEICNDKWKTFMFIQSLGLKTPKTFLKKCNVVTAICEGEIKYPIILKPRWGMASLGLYRIDNEAELEVLSEKCKNEIFNSYLKYESSLTKDDPIIYQEMINGNEYGVDIINDLNGNYVAAFPKQKIQMRSGETDLGLTVCPASFINLSKTISKHSMHQGILSVDCIENESGISIIELNCRISGHYPVSHLAGVNYPQLLVDWLCGKETNNDLLNFKEGLYITKDLVPTLLA